MWYSQAECLTSESKDPYVLRCSCSRFNAGPVLTRSQGQNVEAMIMVLVMPCSTCVWQIHRCSLAVMFTDSLNLSATLLSCVITR